MKRLALSLVLFSVFSTAAFADPPATPVPGGAADLELFQEAFTYARRSSSYGGASMDEAAARAWAMDIARDPRGSERMSAHKEAIKYARKGSSYGGLGLENAEAVTFANRITGRYEPAGGLDRFENAYTYARRGSSYGGLGLEAAEARALALQFASRTDGDAVLTRYRESYTLGRRGQSYGGLGLSPEEARRFAADASGLSLRAECNLATSQTESANWVRALKSQMSPVHHAQADQLFHTACQNGTLSPQLMVQQLTPLLRAPAAPVPALAGVVPALGTSSATHSCLAGGDSSGIQQTATTGEINVADTETAL